MISCEKAELLLSAQLDEALSPRETAQLKAHLAQCPRCQETARAPKALHQEAAGLAVEVPPALVQALQATDWGRIPQERAPAKRKPSPLPWAAGAAAALALVVAGTQLVLPRTGEAGSTLSQLFDRGDATTSSASDSSVQAATDGENALPEEAPAQQDGGANLTQDEAQARLQAYLEEAGEALTLTCQGQEGGVWYFSGQAVGGARFRFAVDGTTGAVTPLPAEETQAAP